MAPETMQLKAHMLVIHFFIFLCAYMFVQSLRAYMFLSSV